MSFNPHTHAGCDPVNTAAYTRIKVSIHTPTQGVTSRFVQRNISSVGFNPHTHAGCDTNKTTNSIHTKVSIHTPTQGVTLFSTNGITYTLVSIHTPTQGVTLYLITYYKSANLIHCYANHHYYSTS